MARYGVLLLAGLLASGCSASRGSKAESTGEPTSNPTAAAAPAGTGKVHKLASGLIYQDIVIGNGKMADPGLAVSVHYTGTLTEGGTPFDSSIPRGQPYQFVLGSGRVIQGWEEGIKGMRVGGKRKLIVPPDMAYGSEGYGGGVIPPNATLLFDIELISVK